jgi:hypothetical protein
MVWVEPASTSAERMRRAASSLPSWMAARASSSAARAVASSRPALSVARVASISGNCPASGLLNWLERRRSAASRWRAASGLSRSRLASSVCRAPRMRLFMMGVSSAPVSGTGSPVAASVATEASVSESSSTRPSCTTTRSAAMARMSSAPRSEPSAASRLSVARRSVVPPSAVASASSGLRAQAGDHTAYSGASRHSSSSWRRAPCRVVGKRNRRADNFTELNLTTQGSQHPERARRS